MERRLVVTVLMAADESPEAVEVLQTARHLFGEHARYLVVNVADRPSSSAGPGFGEVWAYGMPAAGSGLLIAPAPPLDPEAQDRAAEEPVAAPEGTAQAVARQQADEAGLTDAATIGKAGDPVTAILQAADDNDADVIVVGSRERSWFGRLFDPSVSKELFRDADRPVLVVR